MNRAKIPCPVCRSVLFDTGEMKRSGGSASSIDICRECGSIRLSDRYFDDKSGEYRMYNHISGYYENLTHED